MSFYELHISYLGMNNFYCIIWESSSRINVSNLRPRIDDLKVSNHKWYQHYNLRLTQLDRCFLCPWDV